MSPRLKLKRFKVTVPSDEVLAFYTRFYGNRELYFAPESLPPINAKELFGIDAPLVFDLGCGRGDFLIREAAESPHQYFVGIELHWKSIWDAVNKAHQAGLRNVRFLRADVQRVLEKVADGNVSEVFLLFPPPLKQQFFDLPTLRQVQRILCEGGRFHFVTDHADYFEQTCAWIQTAGGFEVVGVEQGFEGGITNFQRRWEGYGIQTNRVEYRRVVAER